MPLPLRPCTTPMGESSPRPRTGVRRRSPSIPAIAASGWRVYLFLPKHVRPPYQTVLFFPSARIDFIADNNNGKALGDITFFRLHRPEWTRRHLSRSIRTRTSAACNTLFPRGSQKIQLTTDRYKDAARTLDYLATRSDIDNSKLAYLGRQHGVCRRNHLCDTPSGPSQDRHFSRWRLFPRFATARRRSGRLRSAHEKARAHGERTL